MMVRMRSAIAATGVLVLALAGCAAGGGSDGSASAPPVGTTRTASPPPTPTTPGQVDEDAADPATWVIDDGRIGPVEIGADFDEVLAQLPAEWVNDDSCAWVAYWSAPDGSYLVSFQRDAEARDTAVVEATVEWLSSTTGIGPRTADGLGVGATQAAVSDVFPDVEEVPSPIEGTSFLRVAGRDEAALFFEYPDGQDGAQSVSVSARETPAYEACA